MGGIRKLLPWLLIGVLLLCGVWLWGYHKGRASVKAEEVIDTSYVVTSNYKSPAPIKEVGIGEVSVPVVMFPTSKECTDTSRHIPNVADTVEYLTATGSKDSLWVTIPITQKEYRDSNYTAYVSGYMPKLDSIQIYSKTIIKTQTVTKRNGFNIGLTGGYGYGFFSHKVEPFVGVGITWNIFR